MFASAAGQLRKREAKIYSDPHSWHNQFYEHVIGDTAKKISERFGKVLQQRQSISINRQDKSTSISTQMDSLIPASKISNLSQGTFVGSVADNFDERIEQKIFHAEIIVDNENVKRETERYVPIPPILDFRTEEVQKQAIQNNYKCIKEDITQLVNQEFKRINHKE